ncbi:MAG TPA: Arc family DNA-binding protein [Acidobacteriaceae bacterium]
MATLHIRDLKETVKEKLRVRAARNGRSMEAEAREILEDATNRRETQEHVYHRIRRAVAKYGPMDLEIPPREPAREPPTFD